MANIGEKINNILSKNPNGLTAREIASKISETKKDVNSYLYYHEVAYTKLPPRNGSMAPVYILAGANSSDDIVLNKLNGTESAKTFTLEEYNRIADWSCCNSHAEEKPAGTFYSKFGKKIEYDSKSELLLLQYLEDNNLVLAVGGQSLCIKYDSAYRSDRNYYPDIIALTKDFHIAIFEVKAAGAMANHTNIEKYNALSAYCKSHGYLYAMIDPAENYITYEEFRDMPVCQHLIDTFAELAKQVEKRPSALLFDSNTVDRWYDEFGSGYTKKEFRLQVHSMIVYYDWYNKSKYSFKVYGNPVAVD